MRLRKCVYFFAVEIDSSHQSKHVLIPLFHVAHEEEAFILQECPRLSCQVCRTGCSERLKV